MKYQVLFSLKINEKVFINVVCCSLDGALRVKTWNGMGQKWMRLSTVYYHSYHSLGWYAGLQGRIFAHQRLHAKIPWYGILF